MDSQAAVTREHGKQFGSDSKNLVEGVGHVAVDDNTPMELES